MAKYNIRDFLSFSCLEVKDGLKEDTDVLFEDDVTVFLNKDMDVSKIKCVGNVNLKTNDIVSISKQADLDHEKKVAVITGDVKVWQGENYLEGEKVFIYYEEERIVVDKGTDKRVTIIFKPGNEGKKEWHWKLKT